ncbi:MAG: glycosyltransferase [Candidatus Berkelbacteria bacterium]|nr:glycosyltransferase [Candidatus Berkelbacteria bacterium]
MAKISCVMPCRNRGDIIGESIQSIIDQTEKDWELIIVDDHSDSSDKTEEVVKSFADERIKYFKLDDKFGKAIASARNFGSVLSSSKYIAVADSDDLCYEYRFEETIKAFEKNDADVVYGDMDYWYPETGLIEKRDDQYKAKEFSLEELKQTNFIPHGTSAYKRQLAVDFPYNTFFRVAEDFDFFTRLAKYGYKFHFINKSLMKYRVHEKSITKQSRYNFSYGDLVKYNRGWRTERPQMEQNGQFAE